MFLRKQQENNNLDPALQYQKKRLFHARLSTCISFLSFCMLAVLIFSLAPSLFSLTARLDTISQNLADVDIAKMSQNINTLTEKTSEGIDTLLGEAAITLGEASKTLSSLNELDIEKLNQSIDDLAAIVDPLAKLFGR